MFKVLTLTKKKSGMQQVLEKCVIFRSSGEGVEAVIKSTQTEIASVISEIFHLAKRSSLLTKKRKRKRKG